MIKTRSRDWDRHPAASRPGSHFLRRSRSAIAVMAFLLALIGTARPARAQYFGDANGNMEGFAVAGKATLAAKPNLIEIDVEVSASSELTADAIVKYRDARRRLREAFAALKLPDVTVEERGLQVDQKGQQQNSYFWGGMPNTRNKTEVQLTRKLVVKASNLRKMDEEAVMQLVGKLLDVAQDAGAKVGQQNDNNYYWRYNYNMNQQGLVRFVLEDFDKLEEEAYQKAVADARARAERLARLSGVALGPIAAVREIIVPGDRANYNYNYYNNNFNSDDEIPRKRLETSKYQDIPVKVELMVRFLIQPKADAKGKAGGK
jgi:uncharacterized protein YggE